VSLEAKIKMLLTTVKFILEISELLVLHSTTNGEIKIECIKLEKITACKQGKLLK